MKKQWGKLRLKTALGKNGSGVKLSRIRFQRGVRVGRTSEVMMNTAFQTPQKLQQIVLGFLPGPLGAQAAATVRSVVMEAVRGLDQRHPQYAGFPVAKMVKG